MTETAPFPTQLAIWGAAWAWSDAPVDEAKNPAALAEHRPGQWMPDELWDKTLTYLDSVERWHGTVRMPVPWWWALAVAPDLVMSGLDAVKAAS